jgi:DNA polymerase-3 subunit delta
VVERPQSGIHFRRRPLVEAALKAWTAERLVKAMSMLAQASFDARRESDLGETIVHRALSTIARAAARRE